MKRTPMAGIDLPGNLPLAWEALAARDAEIERLRSLVEKRERQLVWAARHDLMAYKSRILWLDGSDADFQHGLDWDGTDAGLLAAIDEACPEEETQ